MSDPITAPSWYVEGRNFEPRLVIRDWELSYEAGCALKYISRLGRKGDERDAIEDCRKAIRYLEFEIEAREGAGTSKPGVETRQCPVCTGRVCARCYGRTPIPPRGRDCTGETMPEPPPNREVGGLG